MLRSLRPGKCSTLTAERLRELLDYDPLTGVFIARKSGGHRKAGDIAGSLSTSGYIILGVDGETSLYAHRLAWLYVHGSWPCDLIDHINGDKLDNRIANLRPANRQRNAQNLKRSHADNKTGYLGVVEIPGTGMFYASICAKGKRHWLGRHATAEAAFAAYVSKKRELHEAGTL